MEYPELNEENVLRIFRKGLQKEIQPNTYRIQPVLEGLPTVYFDNDVLQAERNNIASMFGQTKIIHNGDKLFYFQNGKYLYDDTKWTDSDKKLAYFYCLLRACFHMGPPLYDKKGNPFYEVMNVTRKRTRPSEIVEHVKAVGDE